MKTSHLVATLLVTFILAGCSATAESHGIVGALRRLEVGPNYERPATQLPERFRGQPDSSDPASLADLPWRDVFGDASLQPLVREALENNYDLKTAITRVEQYRARQAFWDETIAAYRGIMVRALREVSDGLAAQSKLVEERAAEQRRVQALAAAVDLSLLRYRTGLANYFDVLEAEQQLYPAEDELAQSQRDQLLTVVSLYKALGGDWKLTDDAWTGVR
jgi:multidrug efflux system outer membrane protein